MPRTKLFISYSHRDKPWLDRLQVHLAPLERDGLLDRWDDTRIRPGDDWRQEIVEAMQTARVVVLLVSPFYLASRFVDEEELPPLLAAAEAEGAVVIPVILSPCLFEEEKSLSRYQSINPPSQPLDAMSESDVNKIWVQLVRSIVAYLSRQAPPGSTRPPSLGTPAPAAAPPNPVRPAPVEPPEPAAATPVPAGSCGRHALLIVNDRYDEPVFGTLVGRLDDELNLGAALANPKIGGFSVNTLRSQRRDAVLAQVRQFFANREPDELVLVYVYGLAIKDSDWGLYLAASDTVRDHPTTGIGGHELVRAMAKCKAKRQVLFLDFVYAGAHAADADPTDCAADRTLMARFQGEGRFVLSSPEDLRVIWEKEGAAPALDRVAGLASPPLIRPLQSGLTSGQADSDRNGSVTVDELFQYVETAVAASGAGTPSRWAFDQSMADTVIADASLPGQDQAPPSLRKRYKLTQDIRQPILDLTVPTYVLDDHFYLLDWNPAFDELIAEPLRLVRGRDHAGVFVQNLVNCEDSVRHAKERFGGDRHPLSDSEVLVFQSQRHGKLRFRKLAAQITDENGALKGWSVSLNLLGEGDDALWSDVMARIEEEVSWSRYAVVYDALLLEFPEYVALVDAVTAAIGPEPRRVIDLGCGTGNGALQLLRNRADREVWAVELNETMLRAFRTKLADEDSELVERLTILKDNLLRLDGLPAATFDAATMINVLYAVRDREACLRSVNRILKQGGVLALSTPHRDTDLAKLFEALQRRLEERDLLDGYQEQLDAAWARNIAMDELIHRDTIADTVEMLDRNGFEVDGKPQLAYVDSVIVVRAIKVRELTAPAAGSPRADAIPVPLDGQTEPSVAVVSDAAAPSPDSPEVFVSYSSADRSIADEVCQFLESRAIPCWLAWRDQNNREDYPAQIVRTIERCRVMVLILSESANDSEHTAREVALAAARKPPLPIIPLRVSEVPPSKSLAYYLVNVNWHDAFPPPLRDHLPRLSDKINALLSRLAGADAGAG